MTPSSLYTFFCHCALWHKKTLHPSWIQLVKFKILHETNVVQGLLSQSRNKLSTIAFSLSSYQLVGAVQMSFLREFIRYSIASNIISHIVVTISAAITHRYISDQATVN